MKMNITSVEIQERMKKEHPTRVKAVINEYYGGRYGKSGQYLAIIEPYYFKNGNVVRQDFKVIEILETIKKGYGYGNCIHIESIGEIVEILN